MRSSQTGVQGARATLSDPTSGFAIGKFPNAEIGAENWGLQNDQGRVYSTKPVIAGQPVILYAQIDFLNGNDRMQLWVLPCPVTILPPTADIDIMNTNLSGFAEVVWQTDGLDVQLDELRIVP